MQFCCCILLFGGVCVSLIELSDEMSPIDWIGGGDLDMVGVRVCGDMLFINLVMLYINPIIDYIAFKEAKGKEGLLHWVVYHVTSFIESKIYV